MKTVSRNRSSLVTAFLVVGGLAAFYFYRKNGGKIQPLVDRGVDLAKTARNKINEVAPSVYDNVSDKVSTAAGAIRSRAKEVSGAAKEVQTQAT